MNCRLFDLTEEADERDEAQPLLEVVVDENSASSQIDYMSHLSKYLILMVASYLTPQENLRFRQTGSLNIFRAMNQNPFIISLNRHIDLYPESLRLAHEIADWRMFNSNECCNNSSHNRSYCICQTITTGTIICSTAGTVFTLIKLGVNDQLSAEIVGALSTVSMLLMLGFLFCFPVNIVPSCYEQTRDDAIYDSRGAKHAIDVELAQLEARYPILTRRA